MMRTRTVVLALALVLNLPAAVCQALCWEPVAAPPCHAEAEPASPEPDHAESCGACADDVERVLPSSIEAVADLAAAGIGIVYRAHPSEGHASSPVRVPRAPPAKLASPFSSSNPPLLS